MKIIRKLNRLASRFIPLPLESNIEITPESIDSYRECCNIHFEPESDTTIKKRLNRNLSLGKLIYFYLDGKHIKEVYRYFDLFLLVIDRELISCWRNTKQYPVVNINKVLIDRWNEKYDISKHVKEKQ